MKLLLLRVAFIGLMLLTIQWWVPALSSYTQVNPVWPTLKPTRTPLQVIIVTPTPETTYLPLLAR